MIFQFTSLKNQNIICSNMQTNLQHTLVRARARGQITIPIEIRRQLNIKRNTWLRAALTQDGKIILNPTKLQPQSDQLSSQTKKRLSKMEQASGILNYPLEIDAAAIDKLINQQLDQKIQSE
jgi:AbrB family looped-hinge helix DNA binding protein